MPDRPSYYPADWQSWAQCVLANIGAPPTPVNLASLWGWTGAEKPGGQPVQWNNPLNTTQDAEGASDQNSVGVKSYPSLNTGCAATAQTLQNGRYRTIVQNLQQSVPSSQWGNACDELGTWGTGCGWLGASGKDPLADVPILGGLLKGAPGDPLRVLENLSTAISNAASSVVSAIGDEALGIIEIGAGLILIVLGLYMLGLTKPTGVSGADAVGPGVAAAIRAAATRGAGPAAAGGTVGA